MILVDTSVWIDHFRRPIPALVRELGDGSVVSHPFVIGELALGHLGKAPRLLICLANSLP